MSKFQERGHEKHEELIRQANAALAEKSAAVQDDPYRLRYHLMPPAGWMNDPNGLIYYKGAYHAFYQHYPYEASWGPMHWGHAISRDLVSWEHLPVALAPSEPYDAGDSGGYGCWSGSAVDDNGVLTLIYTGHVDGRTPVEVQCLATSTDGVTFRKAENNPVIAGPPQEGGFGFRDPKVWQHDGVWYMVIGYGKEGNGQALMYTSPDLREWRYLGVAAESDGTMGDMWECPDLFPLGDEHALIFSPMNMGATKTMVMIGKFDHENGRFEPRFAERLDYGFDFYAPQTFVDGQGRRILLGWMNIWGARMPEQAHGWMGAFTLPRELTLAADGTLRMTPAAELRALRGEHRGFAGVLVAAGDDVSLPGVHGDALELIAVFDTRQAGGAAEFGLKLRCSADGAEHTKVAYAMADRTLRVDRTYAGAGEAGVCEVQLEPLPDGRLKLHIFLDRSSVELFIGDGVRTVTNRIYPAPDSLGVKLFASGGACLLESLDVWRLAGETP
ncbi:glycoside hydrolase family 32 protein [Paenibacillus ferrarius]|uniref:glycoside hydrolase family 32 protein n=1 Tax=Paenibacillus ferrarius TaxID=1469647 RepID=UPI003D2757AC